MEQEPEAESVVPLHEIYDELSASIKPELLPGEALIWAGRPLRRPPIPVASIGWAIGCLGVMYLVTAVLMAAFFGFIGPAWLLRLDPLKVLGSTVGAVALLATVAWSCGGIIALLERRNTARETYALTDRRILIWSPGETRGSTNVFAHEVGHFDRVHRVERADGSGDLVFSNSRGRYNPGPQGFREVADVKRVEALVRRYVIAERPDADEAGRAPNPNSLS